MISAFTRPITVFLALVAVLTPACSSQHLRDHPQPLPPLQRLAGEARASRLRQVMLRGPLARAVAGDFLLANGQLVAVVRGIGSSPLGGSLIDVAARRPLVDALGALTPVVGSTARAPTTASSRPPPGQGLAPPRWLRLYLEHSAGAAAVRLVGHDRRLPHVMVEVRYLLRPGERSLQLTTTVTNRGATAVDDYDLGDRIDWGATVAFTPGRADDPGGKAGLPWIGAWSTDVAYAYFDLGYRADGSRSPLRARFAADAVYTVLRRCERLEPGQPVTVQRSLAVSGRGALGPLLPLIYEGIDEEASAQLTVVALSETREPLGGAEVDVRDAAGHPFVLAHAGDDGQARLALPAGSYAVRVTAPGRRSTAQTITVAHDRPRVLQLTTGPPSELVFDVRSPSGGSSRAADDSHADRPTPARLTIVGIDDTPTPRLGPDFSDRAGNTLLTADGKGLLPLPPGRYRVIASRGPAHEVHREELRLAPYRGASLVARLPRRVAPQGYVAVDLDQRTVRDEGCAVTVASRRLSNRAEDLDAGALGPPALSHPRAAAAADERAKDDSAAAAAASSPIELVRVPILTAEGHVVDLIATRTPADVEPVGNPRPALTALPGPDRLIVATHRWADAVARSSDDVANASPTAGSPAPAPASWLAGVDAVQLLDTGTSANALDARLRAWLGLLRAGHRITAVASSASCTLRAPSGYPRTHVDVDNAGAPTAAAIIAGLRRGAAVVSNGPLIALEVEGERPGGEVILGRASGRRRTASERRRAVVTVTVRVHAPSWIPLDALTLIVDGEQWGSPLPITSTGETDGLRLERTLEVPISPSRQGRSFIVALVRSSGTLAPVVQTTLPALAVTNPVWIVHRR